MFFHELLTNRGQEEGRQTVDRGSPQTIVAELSAMKLTKAAKKVEDGIEEALTCCDFPCEHWTRIRTNNVIERLNREIRRRTRVVGAFPDGNSALMPVCDPVGQQEIHEHEASGGSSGRRLHCLLTSFSRSLQTLLRISLTASLRQKRALIVFSSAEYDKRVGKNTLCLQGGICEGTQCIDFDPHADPHGEMRGWKQRNR